MSIDFDRILYRAADREAAIARWDAATVGSPLMTQVARGALLSAKIHTAVFAGEFQGRSVILRHITRPNAVDVVTKMQLELERIGPTMRNGDCQINQLIAADPECGLMIVSVVPGIPFFEADEPGLLLHAGRWHRAYVAARRERGQLSPMHWHKKLADIPYNGLDGGDFALADTLKDALAIQTRALKGFEIARVAGHGDFAPHNFRYQSGVLYAYDIGTGAKSPLARELAHFLFHIALKSNRVVGPWGIDPAQVVDFARAAGLPDAERDSTLRYFFGWYLYRSLLRYARNAGRQVRLRALIQRYLDPLG
ncbi:hypothetical protein [Yoonia maritima]|uniref:hypothetical protein n=1 Tax=Yoonia maritima TaxID=1435347 RepID=UPI000D100BAB|nr:hypothetical protein [Yoonia maritima]